MRPIFQSVVDEFGRDRSSANGALDSIGRIPNVSGALRSTLTWTVGVPTPGLPNVAIVIPEPASALLLGICGAVFAIRRRRS